MAGPSEGAYALINVGTGKALDVYKRAESSGSYLVGNATRNSRVDTQTWVLDNQSSGYQLTCALTAKVLDLDHTKWLWGVQYSDNNATTQRWTIEADGQNYTYSGTSYPTYTIASKKWPAWYLSVDNSGWVLVSKTVNNRARWIFVETPVLSDGGTYEIVLASDTTKCLEIASGSKSTSANCQSNKRNGSIQQVFKAAVNSETGLAVLTNANSGLSLDIWGSDQKYNIAQWKVDSSSVSQKWLIQKDGNVAIGNQTVPTYKVLTLKWNDQWGFSMDGTNLRCDGYSGKVSQRFAFVKTEIEGSSMAVPSEITPSVISVKAPGTVYLKGLQFSSSYTMFQARYKIRKYTSGRKTYKDSNWMNWKDNSTSRDGWGEPWSYAFKVSDTSNMIKLPDTFSDGSKHSVELNGTDCVSADVYIEIRAYTNNYNTGHNAHSSVKQTIVKVRQMPTLSVKSFSMRAENDSISLGVTLADSLGEGCERLRGRLIGEDGVIISDWVSEATMSLSFVLGSTLYRLPNQNEKIVLDYQIIYADEVTFNGSVSDRVSYAQGESSFNVSVSVSESGSCLALITAPRHKSDCCVMEVSSLEGTKLVECPVYSDSSGNRTWVGAPPLNTDAKIIIYSSSGNAENVIYGQASVRIDSHCFMWNWGSSPSSRYSGFAALIVNADEPPQQTRSYTTDIKFHAPSGRTLPVAFAGRSVDVDLSISGVAIDKDAYYYAPTPIPPHCDVEYVTMLARLSGRGIHPTYRTPYGDWYQVGIESVDVSKTKIGYSDVKVKQRALED